MSFVSEVLCSAEKIEIENLHKNIPDISSRIDCYKEDVLQYIERIYNKFSERPKSNMRLLNKANDLKNDISQLENVINNITSRDVTDVKTKITGYKQKLTESKYALEIVSGLIHIHEVLIKMKSYVQNKQYVEGIKQIQEIEVYKNLTDMVQTNAFNELVDKFSKIEDTLIIQLFREFKEYVQYNNNNPFSITLQKDVNISEVFMAIGLFKMDLIDEFVNYLWNNIFCSIINYKVSLDLRENDKTNILIISILNQNEKEHYKEVFKNLSIVAKFLYIHFNYLLRNDISTLNYIGNEIGAKLSDLIINDCLSHTIPANSNELQKYKDVIEDTKHLQNELIKYCIFTEDTAEILKYVENIDVLFINKKCEEYVVTAVEIMKKDLHDMVEMGSQQDESNLLINSTNTFPYCLISKSAVELIELTDKIIQNALTSEMNAAKLYSTVQNIFHMYGPVVQEHHQKLLQTIPQQVALFHNNCMFLSYKLSTSNESYQKLSSVTCIEFASFMEQASLLKQIGNKTFLDSLQQQINQIEDIMKGSGLTSVDTLEKLEPITERSVRQCLRQQELLRTVWHKVLSHSDYNKSIGCILNFLCNFIINELLKIEDISSEAGDQLVDIFKVILTRGPKLFTDSKDVHIYVKSWHKFNELVFILGSSLIEISDRWADSKGPLALQFKPEEVQKLIRALFQNTDRRAAVLAKIVKQ